MPDPTISEVKQQVKNLNSSISILLNEFQRTTGCGVEQVLITSSPGNGRPTYYARVKVMQPF